MLNLRGSDSKFAPIPHSYAIINDQNKPILNQNAGVKIFGGMTKYGKEKSLNEELKKSQDPIKLTVDKDIQFLIRNELVKFNKIFNTKGSAAILMNVMNVHSVTLYIMIIDAR